MRRGRRWRSWWPAPPESAPCCYCDGGDLVAANPAGAREPVSSVTSAGMAIVAGAVAGAVFALLPGPGSDMPPVPRSTVPAVATTVVLLRGLPAYQQPTAVDPRT